MGGRPAIRHGILPFRQDGTMEGTSGDDDDVLAAVGPRLRALRRERGITLAALAAATAI
nr:putative transcriptional regulator [Streptomyces tsukubensis NRRL18488]